MRIAILFEYPTLNGGEQSMLAAVERMPPDEIEIVALAPPQGRLAEALHTRGIPQRPLSLHDDCGKRLPRDAAGRRLLDAIRAAAPDLVHANSLAMGRLTGAVADQMTVPTTAHLRDIIRLNRAAVADLNRNRRLAAVSQATRQFHIKQGIDAPRVEVLYNGIDAQRFQPRPSTGRLRQQLGLPHEAFLIATIGQIGLRKGQDVLAEAAAQIADRLPHAHFLLIGERHSSKTESIEFERNVTRRFEDSQIGSRLHRLGWRDDVAELLNEIDLLVHPARQEPLGRVLLEAAAAGVPIVATDVGGTREILEDGESGLIIPAGDAAALALAIVQLATDGEVRRRLAVRARTTVSKRFDLTRAAHSLLQFWRNGLHASCGSR